MGLLTTDITPTLECMHGAVDQWTVDKDIDRAHREVRSLADDIPGPFKRDRFAGMVIRLLMAVNPERAHKLIDVLGPTTLTTFGYVVGRLVWWGIKGGAVLVFVLGALWLLGVI